MESIGIIPKDLIDAITDGFFAESGLHIKNPLKYIRLICAPKWILYIASDS